MRREVGCGGARRPRRRPPGGDRSGAARRPGAVRRRRRSTASTTTRRSCRPPTSSRRSSTTRPTSARSPRPTPAATCSRWADGSCWRSTSPPSPSTSRARRSRRSSRPPRRSSPRPVAPSPAGTRSATPSRSSGSPCRASSTPTGCSARPAPGRVTPWCSRSRSAPAWRSPAASDGRQGGRHRRHAPAQPRRLRDAAVASATAVHAVTDVTGYGLAGHGWEVAERSGVRLVVDTAGLVAYPGASPRPPSGACARAAIRATATTSPATSTRRAAAALEALCFDPQTSGGLLAAVDPRRRRRARRPTGSGRSARSRPALRPSCCDDRAPFRGHAAERPRHRRGRLPDGAGRRARVRRRARDHGARITVIQVGVEEAGADPLDRAGAVGRRATTSSSASTRSAAARGPGR